MNSKIAVKLRIEELCKEHNMTVNSLAVKSKLTASTVYSLLNEKSQNPGIVTIDFVCKGLGINLREFFNSDMFD